MKNTILPSISRGSLWTAALALVLSGAACSDGPGGETGAAVGAEAPEEHADEHGDEHEEEGEPGRVVLTEAGHRTAGIEVVEAREEAPGAVAVGTEVPGHVDFDPARVALVSPRAPGRIERLTAVEGDRVGAGQPVAYVLSPAFLTAQNDFVQAARRAELLAGTGDEEGARALAAAARRRLQLLGAPPAAIERLEEGGEPLDLLPIVAPFAGNVVEMLTLPGAAVEAGSPIYKLADLSAVDVVADVPESALSRLRRGQSASIRLSAYPGREYTGRVERIRQALDPETRTAKAVIRVPNADGTLRPGMFASVTLEGIGPATAAAPGARAITVPASAVVTEGAERYVFVEVAPLTYERRPVEVAAAAGDRVRILGGLAAGERVVARGAFTLKSELGKAAFGGHAH